MTNRSPDVGRWLEKARGGCNDALGQALEACRVYLLLIAGEELDPELRGKGDASDLVQETFLEAQRDFARFQGATPKEWRAWLRRLLLNNVADFGRRYRATTKRDAALELSLDDSGGPVRDLAAADTTASGHAIAREESEALHAALARLPEDYRRVILLRYQEQLSFEEIGSQLGRTPNAARMLWLRAVDRLRQEIGMTP
jgi:RNA polymerase sigma-70 factor (ECF subfamily)